MIELSIPGRGLVRLEHLVCDVSGTLTVDGQLVEGVARALSGLRDRLEIHLLTADNFGRQELIDRLLNLTAIRLDAASPDAEPGYEARQKQAYVEQIGAERVVAIGQGANDAQMLRAAKMGIAVVSAEGTAFETLAAADLVVPNIITALELLEKPLRLVATLRK